MATNVATGVPSRMNVGQIFENLLGSAGRWNGEEYRVGAFDEMFSEEASRGVEAGGTTGSLEVTAEFQMDTNRRCPEIGVPPSHLLLMGLFPL